MVEFRILGPVEVIDRDKALALGGQKQRAVLAALLIDAGRVVSTDYLVDALWGERPPKTAATSLQNFVSQLRKALGPEVLVTKPPGYQLRLEPGQLDLDRFMQLVEEARGAGADERSATLRKALALWRGAPFADFTFESFAQPEIARLSELRLSVLEERIDADLEAGRHAELVGELEPLVAEYPLRERLRAQLMLALYRAGRQAEALQAYQDARSALVDELGIEPSPELSRLHGSILRQDSALDRRDGGPPADDHFREVARELLAGRVVPVLGADVGDLAAQLAERFDYPASGEALTRISQYVSVMRGSGPLYDELHTLLDAEAVPTAVHRLFASLPPLLRERGVPHQLLVTTSFDLALEQAFLERGEEFDVVFYIASGRDRGRFCHIPPDGAGAGDRDPEHLHRRALARAPHDHPQAPRARRSQRRPRARELRRHRGRLHRLPRAVRRLRSAAGRADREAAAQPLPLPRLRDDRLEPPRRPEPALGRPRAQLPLVGRAAGGGRPRAGVLAPARGRRGRAAARGVRGGARARGRRRGGEGVNTPGSPYKGLAAFGDSSLDAMLFFGRERERDLVIANMTASRLTLLYGPTGVGKSSLLNAGVARSLREDPETRRVALFNSWIDDRTDELRDAVADSADGYVYVILDQFEEFFLYHDVDSPFGTELASLLGDRGLRVNVLLSLREDTLAVLDAFKGRIANLYGNSLRLDHLDRESARAAVLGPLRAFEQVTGEHVEAEPELVEAVLDEVATGRLELVDGGRGQANGGMRDARIEAPFLQLVLERLWDAEREAGSDTLRLQTLVALGGAEAIVREHLDRALAGLASAQKDVAASIFDRLVTPSGTKIAHRAADLAEYASVDETELGTVLETLGHERILREVEGENGGGPRYEIFHDVLADAVLAWRAERRLERERQEAERKHRRLLAVAVGSMIALALTAAVAVFALTQRSQARSQAHRAHARELDATALASLATDPQQGLRDALSAAQLSPGVQAEDVLRTTLLASRLRAVLPAGGPVTSALYSTDGRLILTASTDGKARLYDASTHRLLRTLDAGSPLAGAVFDPSGRLRRHRGQGRRRPALERLDREGAARLPAPGRGSVGRVQPGRKPARHDRRRPDDPHLAPAERSLRACDPRARAGARSGVRPRRQRGRDARHRSLRPALRDEGRNAAAHVRPGRDGDRGDVQPAAQPARHGRCEQDRPDLGSADGPAAARAQGPPRPRPGGGVLAQREAARDGGQRRVGPRVGFPVRRAPRDGARPHQLRHRRGVQPRRVLARDDERRSDGPRLEAGYGRDPGRARRRHRLGHRAPRSGTTARRS